MHSSISPKKAWICAGFKTLAAAADTAAAVFFVFLALTSLAVPGSEANASPASDEREDKGLASLEAAHSKRWLRLLHYQDNGWSGSRRLYKSTIDHPAFFFASEGKHAPEEELRASRKALRSGVPSIGPKKMDPACVFPARARFFEEVFGDAIRQVPCEGLEHWRKMLRLRSVSLVFSTAYAGNPASMLGHTFLKLNTRSLDPRNPEAAENPLLDYAASFMAIPEDDWALLYFAKGVGGGYTGAFRLDPFYAHMMSYAYVENRDLWEYEFTLTPEERRTLIEHFWELVHTGHSAYYFLDDNCSNLILEVLEAVRPEIDLKESVGLIGLPNQAIRVAAKQFGEHEVRFYPSQRKEFRTLIASLDSKGRGQVARLISGLGGRQGSQQGGPQSTRRRTEDPRTLDAALAYLNYKKSTLNPEDQESVRSLEEKLLVRRSKLGKSPTPKEQDYDRQNRPDLGHGQSKVALGWLRDGADDSSAIYFRARYGMHDIVDPPQGYETYYHMNIFDLKAAVRPDGPGTAANRIKDLRFTLAEVESLSPIDAFFARPSWKALGGVRASRVSDCDLCLGLFGGGGIGAAYELAKNRLLAYGMAQLSADLVPLIPRESQLVPGFQANLLFFATAESRMVASAGIAWKYSIAERWREPVSYTRLKAQTEITEAVFLFGEYEAKRKAPNGWVVGLGSFF